MTPIIVDSTQSLLTNQMRENIIKLIGIPFKIGREDLKGCDCVGICWLYHKLIHNKNYPHRDGKMLVFRDRRKDIFRIINVIETWARHIPLVNINEGDIVLMKGEGGNGCLGVAVNKYQILCMQDKVGSRLIKIDDLKTFLLRVYRPNENI